MQNLSQFSLNLSVKYTFQDLTHFIDFMHAFYPYTYKHDQVHDQAGDYKYEQYPD